MKKNLIFLVGFFVAMFLHSCTISTDITYHKDAAMTTVVETEFRDMLEMANSQGGEETEKLSELAKIPQQWTSLYDLQKQEGKEVSTNPDSIRLMKKVLLKGNFDVKDLVGLSIKMDHFLKKDFADFREMKDKDSNPLSSMSNEGLQNWDGKRLVINTQELGLENIENIIAEEATEDEEIDVSQMKSMLQMMLKKVAFNLRFENKIKSISGHHDWIKQVDDHTIQLTYDIEGKELKNKDKEIVIITE